MCDFAKTFVVVLLIGWLAVLLASLAVGMGCVRGADCNATSEEAEAVVIPLDQIWAIDMPGTHRIISGKHNDDLKYAAEEGPVMHEIFMLLENENRTKGINRAAFAIQGTNVSALKNACKTLLSDKDVHGQSLSSGKEVSLFFLTGKCHNYLHLRNVTRLQNRIVIRYQFVGHVDAGLYMNLAVIPLGKLPVGKYQVEIEQLPMDKKYRGWNKVPSTEELSHIVAKAFSFSVEM